MANAYLRPEPLGSGCGKPVTLSAGPLAGRTVRVELEEIQKADAGRKYGRKDRRPIDPPPVVLCRFFEVIDRAGVIHEEELGPEESSLGAVCHIDLFPALRKENYGQQQGPQGASGPSTLQKTSSGYLPKFMGFSNTFGSRAATSPASASAQLSPTSSSRTSLPPINTSSPCTLPLRGSSAAPTQCDAGSPVPTNAVSALFGAGDSLVTNTEDDAVARFQDGIITESSKLTDAISGATFTDGLVVNYDGKASVMFVFHDLAVKTEGTFVLRYRVLSVYSEQEIQHWPAPILAECFGGPFKVYPSKRFPGLAPSTELTKQLALYYRVPVNLREKERKRRKKGGDADSDLDEPSMSSPVHPKNALIAKAGKPVAPSLPGPPPPPFSSVSLRPASQWGPGRPTARPAVGGDDSLDEGTGSDERD
ncbi:velvet factor-domain-containing protein [Trametes meyenii]|nr:velvet factor-domain-containing protein [Trametes meyenii]